MVEVHVERFRRSSAKMMAVLRVLASAKPASHNLYGDDSLL
jgi:hypothetical protein